jgi:hypothetical protein
LFGINVETQGVSLWYFHVYTYYNISQCFYLSPFLMVVSDDLRFLYSFFYREYINHIQVLSFLLLPYSSRMWSPLSVNNVL